MNRKITKFKILQVMKKLFPSFFLILFAIANTTGLILRI